MIEIINENTKIYQKNTSKSVRKKKGQFFTPLKVSKYMAHMSKIRKKNIKILDCGAGTGILGLSLLEELLVDRSIETIQIDFYENDEEVLTILNKNIMDISNIITKCDKKVVFNIVKQNFITFNKNKWEDKNFKGDYDIIISNPPYKKLKKSEDESNDMFEVVHGQPNIYFLFMAMAIHLLKKDGEMIFITPRSFTSGAYFKKFRNYMINSVNIVDIHIFDSRNLVFKGEEVLQEAIITRCIKNNNKEKINIISTANDDFLNKKMILVDYSLIVDEGCENKFIKIPTTNNDIKILKNVKRWNNNLITLGFKLKTGPVVDFRVKEYLINDYKDKNRVPLFWSDNFIENKIEKVNDNNNFRYVIYNDKSDKFLLKNQNYLLVKRFTTKEETRRLQVAIYDMNKFKKYNKIGIENHVNYITKIDKEIELDELYGLFCLFNSTILDKYYRMINGNTQVNATEGNMIPLPNIDVIKMLGKELIERKQLTTNICDEIIEKLLNEGDFILNKIEEARVILKAINSPKSNDLACNVLLALANITNDEKWENSTCSVYTTRKLMDFMRDNYNVEYKANTRETVRKDVLHYFLMSSIVETNKDNPERATNSPKFCYSLTKEFLILIRAFGSEHWELTLKNYNNNLKNMITKYKKERNLKRIPLIINNQELTFSPGKHNELQKAIIEDFAPIFAGGAEILYVGDTEKKDLIKNKKKLVELGFNMDDNSKLPDVILYVEKKNWIYFVEAVTSVGPMSEKRIIEINEMMIECNCGAIFVTAFLDKATFKKFIVDLAWETEVWIAEQPEHMVHLNGDRFLGPR